MHALDRIHSARLMPLVTLPSADAAHVLGRALADAELDTVEITLRSQSGMDGIRTLAARGDLVVGAGTVLAADDVDRVADAGAAYIVSPGLDPDIVARAQDRGIPALPGVATASEVQHAHRLGLSAVKFFPADALGGLPTIRALAAPFPRMRFLPSGGVSAASAPDYLRSPAVLAISGSWMLDATALRAGDHAGLVRSLRTAVAVRDRALDGLEAADGAVR